MFRTIVVLLVLGVSGCFVWSGFGPWLGKGYEPKLEQTVVQVKTFSTQKLIRLENPLDEEINVVVDCGSKEATIQVKGHSYVDFTWDLDSVDNRCFIAAWNFAK